MTVSPDRSGLVHRTAALCALLGSREELRQPGVREAAERARDLLRSGAGADELTACFDDLDHVLRRAGYAGGLLDGSRGAAVPGVTPHLKVAVCPGPARCSRTERARDLLPAPHCAVHDTRMHKARLRPGR
ncbi:hypothetical protein H0H10_24175 [Streptomyces sp. TRM S81-3]|uniref:Uncharacterized protein n=1 Tax=Streptomyces griseicoloratus TaxID=2752516 RepID=A0A926QSN4_9ACTN|nr:hypothetical protein [Streptomyces griseicoloratus]MBD0422216.1 hypothetical protein [Streptomyces griseicoloratus]